MILLVTPLFVVGTLSGALAALVTGRADASALQATTPPRPRALPPDLFAATMLGELAIVRATLETRPALARVPGPHGIPLIAHAKAGGPAASQVLEYVNTVLTQLERKDSVR